MKRIQPWFFLCILTVFYSRETKATERSPWTYTNVFGVTVNSLGILDTFAVRWQQGLYLSENPLLRDNFVSVTGALGISPVYLRPTLRLEVQPLSIIKLEASYEPEFYFGNNGFLPSYAYANADYPLSFGQSAPHSADGGHAALVHQLYLSATLQFAYGPFALQNVARGLFSVMSAHEGDRAFYNVDEDILLAGTGWMLHNTTLLLATSKWGGSAGVSHSLIATSYPQNAYPQGTSTTNENSPISRIGPIFMYEFNDRETGAFQKPTLIFMLNWYISQRYRTGRSVSNANPLWPFGIRFFGGSVSGPFISHHGACGRS